LTSNEIGEWGAAEIEEAYLINSLIKIDLSHNKTKMGQVEKAWQLYPLGKIQAKFKDLSETTGKGVQLHEAYYSSTPSKELFRSQVIEPSLDYTRHLEILKQIGDLNSQQERVRDWYKTHNDDYEVPPDGINHALLYSLRKDLKSFIDSLNIEEKVKWDTFLHQTYTCSEENSRYNTVCTNVSAKLKGYPKKDPREYLENLKRIFLVNCCDALLEEIDPDLSGHLIEELIFLKRMEESL
jgi:hypothetical protein